MDTSMGARELTIKKEMDNKYTFTLTEGPDKYIGSSFLELFKSMVIDKYLTYCFEAGEYRIYFEGTYIVEIALPYSLKAEKIYLKKVDDKDTLCPII